jgi:hypothetical protein
MFDTKCLLKRLGWTVLLIACALISFDKSLFAQQTQATPEAGTVTRAETPDNDKQKPPSATSPEATATKSNPSDARKAQILEDTNRLYRMAEELKAEVAKSNKDILSVAVVKKADEIEKLAKSLKDRMRNE